MALNKGIWDPKRRGTNIQGTNLKSSRGKVSGLSLMRLILQILWGLHGKRDPIEGDTIQFPSVPLSCGCVGERTGTQSYMTTVITQNRCHYNLSVAIAMFIPTCLSQLRTQLRTRGVLLVYRGLISGYGSQGYFPIERIRDLGCFADLQTLNPKPLTIFRTCRRFIAGRHFYIASPAAVQQDALNPKPDTVNPQLMLRSSLAKHGEREKPGKTLATAQPPQRPGRICKVDLPFSKVK